MQRISLALVLAAVLFTTIATRRAWPNGVSAPAPDKSVKFATVDIYIDTRGVPLAAYQVELRTGTASVVGIEGGDASPFKPAPYYDPRALSQNRVIIAAYGLDSEPPTGRTRVARVHLQYASEAAIDCTATLDVTGGVNGLPIVATVSTGDGGSR